MAGCASLLRQTADLYGRGPPPAFVDRPDEVRARCSGIRSNALRSSDCEMTYPRYQEHKVPICGGHLYVSNDCEHVRWTGAIGDDGMPVNHRSSRGTGPATPLSIEDRYNMVRDEWEACAPLPREFIPHGRNHPYGGALAEHEGRLFYSYSGGRAELLVPRWPRV